jgi:hypothetical protein
VGILPTSRAKKIKCLGCLALFMVALTPSRFAKAGQTVSQNLEVAATVAPSCGVSTERGASGAQLDAGCPSEVRQSLVRELVVDPEHRTSGGSAVTEQLILVINF